MKRNFTLTLLLVLASFMVKAQLPDGSIAPDFTTTDIDGNTHTLYEYLDQGKTVVIDFMATWCGPCWNYHMTHATTDIWNDYGPDGTDEMVVLMIESDQDTELECLYGDAGCTGGTIGNWVDISPFPVIDDHTIGPNFQVGYYPTVYHICPNRIIVEAGQVGAADLLALNGTCLSASGDNNAGILEYNGFSGSFCGSVDFAPSIKFQNLGNAEMTSATFELWLNGTMTESMDWTGSLTTYQFEDIVFSDVTVTEATTVEVVISSVNGATDEDDSNNSVTAEVAEAATANSLYLTLELQTDNWPAETSWEFVNSMGTVVASGGGYTGQATLYTEEITLPDNDCFEFIIYDSYGDGICCAYGPGFYRLLDPNGDIMFEGGSFTNTFTEAFKVEGAVSVQELDEVTSLNVFPNPVASNLNVQFNLAEAMPLDVTVFNTLGQQVSIASQDFVQGSHTLNVDVSEFSNGVYYVRFANGEKQLTTKFTVLK